MHDPTHARPDRIPVAAPRTTRPTFSSGAVRERESFEAFAAKHQQVMRDYIQRRLHGADGVSGEDALQDALVRIWRQWDRWPTDPDRRQAYMRQALKVAAIDAIRARHGRGEHKVREISINFNDIDSHGHGLAESGAEHLARELGRAVARDSLDRQHDRDDRIDRSVLVAAFAALDEHERHILALTATGHDGKQIATQLGLRHQHVREKLMRARRLLRSLIEHASGGTVRPEEAKRLWAYRDNELTGKPRREVQRHLQHCHTCQQLLAGEQRLTDATITAFLPLPLAATIGTWLAGNHATSAAAEASNVTAAGGAGLGSGSVFGPGGLLAGLTAKTAVALGAGAVALSAGGVTKLYVDRERPIDPAAATLASASDHIPAERPLNQVAARPVKDRARRAPRNKRPSVDHRSTSGQRAVAPTPTNAGHAVASTPAPSAAVQQTAPAGDVFALGAASAQDADTVESATATPRP